MSFSLICSDSALLVKNIFDSWMNVQISKNDVGRPIKSKEKSKWSQLFSDDQRSTNVTLLSKKTKKAFAVLQVKKSKCGMNSICGPKMIWWPIIWPMMTRNTLWSPKYFKMTPIAYNYDPMSLYESNELRCPQWLHMTSMTLYDPHD